MFYRLYEGEEELIDEWGNSTGEYAPKYGALKSAMLCVSPNKGTSETEQFGSIEQYDRTMSTSDPKCPIDENTVLWIDGADTSGPWTYVVKSVGRWKNSTSYAIAKVTVSTNEILTNSISNGVEAKNQRPLVKEGTEEQVPV